MTSTVGLGECCGVDCIKPALFTCSRCKAAHYCSDVCNKASWNLHKKYCKKVGEQADPYEWESPNTKTRQLWTVSDMQKGPEQPMDPPEDYDYIKMWWEEREFLLHGKVVVKASMIPPQLKSMIQTGLKEKRLTWDYLMSDNFMHQAVNSTLPIDMFSIYLNTAIQSEVKPKLSALLEIATEHFWRTKGMPGLPEYNVNIAKCLKRHKITLPFKFEGHNVDEFRLFTHSEGCECYNCLSRSYLDDKNGERWEMLRASEGKKGRYMASWASVKEFEKRQFDAYLWDIDTSQPGKYKKWSYEPDKDKNLQHLTSKQQVTDICKMLDLAAKCKRPPTHEELDWVFSLANESKVPPLPPVISKSTTPTVTPTAVVSHSSSHIVNNTEDSSDKMEVEVDAETTTTTNTKAVAVVNGDSDDSQTTKLPDNHTDTVETMSVMKSVDVMDVDPDYSLAAYRPRRASALKKVSYAESSSDENDSQRTTLDDQQHHNSKNSSSAAMIEDEEECSDWEEDSDATRLESDSESDSDATVLEQSSTDSDLTVCDVNELKKNQQQAMKSNASPRVATKKVSKVKSNKVNQSRSSTRMCWSPEQDDQLREAVSMFGNDWNKVANQLNCSYGKDQCKQRWIYYVSPEQQSRNKDRSWSIEEVEQLKQLVELHKTSGYGNKINWNQISKELNREYKQCKNKWASLCYVDLKKGPFSPEEDAIILKRVREWGDKGKGLWVELGNDLGRGDKNVRKRWTKLSKRQ